MSQVRKSLFFSFAEKYSGIIIQLLSTVALARLLTPEQIGVFSVAAVVISLAHMFRDFGIAQYIVQETELTQERLRCAFSFTLLWGWALGALLALFSEPIARFYDEPGVGNVLRILSLNFFLLPFGSVAMATLRRELDFAPIYKVKLTAALVHAVVTVSMAALGFGYLSMAWGGVAGVLVTVLLIVRYRPDQLSYVPSFVEWRRVFSFGSFASGSRVLREIGDGAPDLVMGRVLTMEAVGLFGRAMSLVRLFETGLLKAVMPIVLPHLAAQKRAQRSVAMAYVRTVTLVTGISWPFYGFLAIMAYPVIRVLFGDQWDAAVPVAQVLCIYGAIASTYYFADQMLIAMGAVRKTLVANAILQPTVFILCLVFAHQGIVMVASALVVSGTVGLVVYQVLLNRITEASLSDMMPIVLKGATVSGFTLIGPAIVKVMAGEFSDGVVMPLVLAVVTASLGWLVGIKLARHPILDELRPIFVWLRNVGRA